MIKYFLSLFITLFFIACGGGSSSSTSDIASVPHSKSSIPMLGVLVNYNNVSVSSSVTIWSNKLFGKSEHQLNHYYQEVSNLNFEFAKATEDSGYSDDGIISVNLNKNHPDSTDLSAIYPDLRDALEAADGFVDFSNYDTDGNGHITPEELILTFIIAGKEDAYAGGHVTNGVWAHEYCMEKNINIPTLDGVSLMSCSNNGNFALFGERHDNHDATIGIIAHELGHSTFRLPDLYNTSNQDSGGIGYFGLMGGGAWGRMSGAEYPGNTPVHFTAWSKTYTGWFTPQTLNGYVSIKESSSNEYNIIKVPIDATHYYLLENRNNSGYDRGLYSLSGTFTGGMALWKIDTSKLTATYFDNNSVNADTQNKGVDLIEASPGTIDSLGSAGDEDALFYNPNRVSYETTLSNISSRGTTMFLNIN